MCWLLLDLLNKLNEHVTDMLAETQLIPMLQPFVVSIENQCFCWLISESTEVQGDADKNF
jgi:hypothetical protein